MAAPHPSRTPGPSCSGKMRHATRAAALVNARRRRGDWHETWRVQPVEVYRCPHCHGYHVGRDSLEGGHRVIRVSRRAKRERVIVRELEEMAESENLAEVE